MTNSDEQIRARAAALSEEISLAVQQGQMSEWVEEVLGVALIDVARNERSRCATIAERRAELWEGTARRMSSGSWPLAAVTEARERHKEAIFIADAIRSEDPFAQ